MFCGRKLQRGGIFFPKHLALLLGWREKGQAKRTEQWAREERAPPLQPGTNPLQFITWVRKELAGRASSCPYSEIPGPKLESRDRSLADRRRGLL